jgi:serine/threonine-protein kinase
MQAPLPVKPGEILHGKYRVERVIGQGGMGAVVSATHLQLEQTVAIKFLYTHAQNHPEALARFQREARAAVKLKSEHVARVIDVGQLEATGAPFIVMEFLEGQDLADVILARGSLPSHEAVSFVLQACEAVGEAHTLGIVHRDLKPKNLFLTTTAKGLPLVKVLDFGISKLMTGDDLSLTRTQTVIGSPNYMSPEQLRSARDVDQRADIWALGAILYELLTAHVPFPAETVTQLTAMVIADPPTPIESYRTDLTDGLKAVVAKCLAKARDDRYATVEELATALLPFAAAGTHFSVPAHSSGDALSASSSGAHRPSERPSIRVPGGETSSAWGDTQLATSSPSRRWPIIAGVGLFSVVAGVVAVLSFKHHDAVTPGKPGETVTVTVTVTAPPPASTPVAVQPTTTDALPTTRQLPAGNPLVSPTGGPVRPLPTGLGGKKDGGTQPATTTTASGGDDLPTVRH